MPLDKIISIFAAVDSVSAIFFSLLALGTKKTNRISNDAHYTSSSPEDLE